MTATLAPSEPAQPEARQRRILRRFVRDVSSVLIISGLLLVVDAAVTLAWQEPVTAVIALVRHTEIDKRFLTYRAAPLTRVERRVLKTLPDYRARLAFLARREQRQVQTGDAIGKIVIPRIGISFDVIQGTDDVSLEKGPGHYPGTAFPGLGHTVAIAGHRTTYLAPFRHIDALKPGDEIVLEMPYGRFVYTVQFHRIVLPTALWVTHNVGYERLVLSACNPLYSATQRIIVFARLSAEVPSGAAKAAA
jgi:sortase A